jgi:sulfur carrier protein ThiS
MAKPEENNQTGIIEIDVETAINNQLAAQAINEEQAAYYINNGLTVVSNNTDIIPRDAAGNVIVQDESYIVIETNSFNIDNISMLKVLDTQFNYFKFPVSVNREFVDPNFDFEFDNISVEFTLPLPTDSKGQIINTQRISTLRSNGWFYNNNYLTKLRWI